MIIIDYSQYEHIKDKSYYNHNYYKPIGNTFSNVYLYEVCNEDYNILSYYLVDGDIEIHIGDAYYFELVDDKITIEKLGETYT